MKRLLFVVAAFLPTLAFAQISISKHNLSTTGTFTVRATTQTQLCIFCHTPHKAAATRLLWNHTATAQAAWTWGTAVTTTSEGTTLPTTLMDESLRCMSCHDGSIAVGSVLNSAGAPAVLAMNGVTGTGMIPATGKVMGATAGDLAGNHPVSISYPVAAGTAYNGAISQANTAGFHPLTVAACASPSGLCTTGPVNGTFINMKGTATAPGMECGTCHDPHNTVNANGFMLRAPQTGSALCLACHIK